MFYDLPNPNKFLQDIKKILDFNGVFILEHADLLSIIKNCQFDTICHEHLEYYSSTVIKNLMKKNDLRVFNIKPNTINGGSMRYFICHNSSNYRNNIKNINSILNREIRAKLHEIKTFRNFFKLINNQRKKLVKLINNIYKKKELIHGYGASTKGNVLLQYFNISNKKIQCIADRNPQKFNLYTPGTKIKIVSEEFSRKCKPNYYLVLPWHFKNEIISREKKTIKSGSKLIFPLPKMKIIK